MPTLKITPQQIQSFEKVFQSSIEQRCMKKFDTVEEAFWTFNTLPDKVKTNFWDPISYKLNMSRERVYKFFRFTWSKQFYVNLNDFREQIKNDVYQLLDQCNEMYDTSIVTSIWKQIWAKYGEMKLHYDATDQFVRNTINGYYKRQSDRVMTKINQLTIQKFEEPEMLRESYEPQVEPKVDPKIDDYQVFRQPFSSLESVEQDTMNAKGFVFQPQQEEWIDESFLDFDQGSLYFD